MGLLAAGAALRESVTYDEVLNIGAGVSYWQKLDLRLSEEHPPLARVIAAFPLILRGVRADYSNIAWTISDRLFPAYAGQLYFGELVLKHWNDPRTTLALGRLPMLALTLLLGCMVYFYARTLGGPWGGVLCTAVYATTPLFLAHGPFVLTDASVAAFTVLAMFTAASLWRSPNRARAVIFGLSLAGAFLAKFSALVLLPALAVFVLSLWIRPLGSDAPNLQLRRFRAALLAIGCMLATVYVFYLVFSWNQPTSALSDLSANPILRRLLMPPWLYVRGLFLVSLSSSRPTYLLGRSYPQGVWFYFPVLLWLKSPLGFLGLLLVCVAAAITRKARAVSDAAAAHWRILWIALIAFTAVCLASNLDIGVRHFSVPLVLLILTLAPLPRMIANLRLSAPKVARALTVLIVACAAQCLVTAVAAYPFYLTYANAFGSLRPHFELFNDSNLDRDQSLPEVERFVTQHGIQSIPLDHYGYTDVAFSVPQSHIWNCESPTAADAGQWVAVSANMISDVRNCRWLLQYPHETLGGGKHVRSAASGNPSCARGCENRIHAHCRRAAMPVNSSSTLSATPLSSRLQPPMPTAPSRNGASIYSGNTPGYGGFRALTNPARFPAKTPALPTAQAPPPAATASTPVKGTERESAAALPPSPAKAQIWRECSTSFLPEPLPRSRRNHTPRERQSTASSPGGNRTTQPAPEPAAAAKAADSAGHIGSPPKLEC